MKVAWSVAEAPAPTPGGDWPIYNGTLDAQRYSPLAQVNVKNAASLTEVCRIKIDDGGSFEAGLIVVGATLYATTATDTIALDAATCAIKWRTVYHRGQKAQSALNRGVAYANGRVFRGTDDARLIALDAQTGAPVWTDVVGDARLGEAVSGAPVAWNGLVFAATASGDFGIRGRVMAFDAATGREAWRFYTIPMGNETGADTWINTSWNKHGGAGSWSSFTIDPSSGELFIPVGNPAPAFTPGDRKGTNLFSNCVVVLNAATGELKWWYQTKASDPYDHDLAAAPVLYRDNKGDERVAAAGKDGYLHIIDRANHTLIAKTPVTTVDTKHLAPTPAGVRTCPGIAGGVQWNGPGFDPLHQTLFVGAVDYCSILKSTPGSPFTVGDVNFGGSWSPGSETATGWITAVDSGTGKIKWKYHTEAPVVSGITSTGGGVVLAGDTSGHFLVFDSVTGTVLKQVPTGGSISGGVITYEQAGRQYIAFTSGNISRSVWGAAGRPTIIVMALPSSRSADSAHPGITDIEHGRELFYVNCAVCHGPDGKNISINGTDLTTVKQRMSLEQIIAWIKNPRPPMPKVFPEPLRPEEESDLHAIATFLHEWRQ